MAHYRHNHRHFRRDPNFWRDVEDAVRDFNPFNRNNNNDDDEDPPRRRGGRDEDEETPRIRNGGTTIVRTVIQTMSPTFRGSVASWSTLKDSTSTRTSSSTSAQSTTMGAGAPIRGQRSSTESAESTAPSVISKPTKTSVPSTLAVATNTPTTIADPARSINANRGASSSPSATAQSSESNSNSNSSGNNAGATAGIVIGVLGGILVVGLVVFWLFNRRKKQLQRERVEDDDEKLNGPFSAPTTAAAVPPPSDSTNPRAPRLSLRPVTQFLPNLNFEKRNSKGANIMLAPAGAAGAAAGQYQGQSAWDRPTTSESANPNNPFGSQAERLPTPITEEPYSPAEKPLPPGPGPVQDAPSMGSGPAMAAAATAGAVAAGALAAGSLTRKASTRKDGPRALDLTLPAPLSAVPASPAGTEFSMSFETPDQPAPASAGAAAIAAAGGPANSTVHRVQLDFKPTLEDEMELKAGQLVRLLHEYDDGWALCIRLDRSQQGVVPRTCLSTRPVKPRPQNGGPRGPPMMKGGPPRGPGPNFPHGQRPMTPQGHPGPRPHPRPESPMRPMTAPGRPASPAGTRGMSPGPRPHSPGPRYQGPPGRRPQSPAGMGRNQSPMGRTHSPAPQGRMPQPSRMNSEGSPVHQQARPGPPTGPVGRKPVPGQAL